MSASIASHSYGTTLGYGSSSTSFTSLAEAIDMGLDPSVGSTKVTNLSSPNAAHEYLPGLFEGGEAPFTINYDKTTYAALYAFARVTKWWKITLPDGGNAIFQGHITKFPVKVPDDDRVTDDMSIKVTGKPTFATS